MRGLTAGLVSGLLISAVAASPVASAVGDPTAPTIGVEDPFERARAAARRVSFTGTVEVRWFDGKAERHEELAVQSAGGSLLVKGGNQVMASSTSERLVQHEDGGWDLLWPPALDRADRPDPGLKYETTEHDGPEVAGRPTTAIDIRQKTVGRQDVGQEAILREQVVLDRETDLLLQRRQFDERRRTTRVVGFTELDIDPATSAPSTPAKSANLAPEPVLVASLPSPGLAPAELADGYARLGVYERDGVVQVLYSDGIYDLSVFGRQGDLDRRDLGGSGAKVPVGKAAGWRYTWPGGQVVLWQAGGTVYTVVSDAPLDQVLAAARDLPVPKTRKPSALERLRSLARSMIQPLA